MSTRMISWEDRGFRTDIALLKTQQHASVSRLTSYPFRDKNNCAKGEENHFHALNFLHWRWRFGPEEVQFVSFGLHPRKNENCGSSTLLECSTNVHLCFPGNHVHPNYDHFVLSLRWDDDCAKSRSRCTTILDIGFYGRLLLFGTSGQGDCSRCA